MAPFSLARAGLLALALALLAGCSMVRMGYPQLDTVALWTADEYFDLDTDQKREFRKRFDRLHEWHRYEQLPDYAAFLAETKSRIEKGLTREDVLWITEGVRARYRTLVRHASDDAAAMLMTITPEQLDSLQQRWERVNRKFVREFRLESSIEEQQRATGRRVLSRIRDWVGHWTMIRTSRSSRGRPICRSFTGCGTRTGCGASASSCSSCRSAETPASSRRGCANGCSTGRKGRDPAYDRLFKEWSQKQADLYAATYRILLPHQREALAERVQVYINDFTYLARRPAAQAAER